MTTHGIKGGIVGIARDGEVVYLRGFGHKDEAETIEMPENALFRIASCTKPMTAAAIRNLIDAGEFSVNDYVFELGQPEGGLIQITPFGGMGNLGLYYEDVTVDHCLGHRGGWHCGDCPDGCVPGRQCELADLTGWSSPISFHDKIRWLLSKDLCNPPGTVQRYANENYIVLGEIVEAYGGQDLDAYIRDHVLTPDMWVPANNIFVGRDLQEDHHRRETWYDSDGHISVCIHDYGGLQACNPLNQVPSPYGSYYIGSRIGSGCLVASAATMLEFAWRYQVDAYQPGIGSPQTTPPTSGWHNGWLYGANSHTARWYNADPSQEWSAVVFFNKADTDVWNYASTFYIDTLEPHLRDVTSWPSTRIDGFWIDPDRITLGRYGSYDRPYAGLDEGLDSLRAGSRVNFLPGNSDWSGTISTKLLIRAPLGTVVIGEVP
jgi:CubicO group peptidase (beta-lactamase class C family)